MVRYLIHAGVPITMISKLMGHANIAITLSVYAHALEEDQALALDALNKINKQSCRFLVAGRRNKGQFCTIEDVNVPYVFKDMFQQIPEDVFRLDISSTQMRC